MDKVIKFLTFLRVIDAHDGQLSLTNLAVLIVLVKLVLAPATSLTDVGALLISLTSYAGKKLLNQSNQKPEEDPQVDEIQKKLEEITGQVSALNIQNGFKS